MTDLSWIMYTGMVIWAGLGLYLAVLARRQNVLARRLRQLTQAQAERP